MSNAMFDHMGGHGSGGNVKGHLIERFYSSTRAMPGGCLIWTGTINKDGYGTIVHQGKYLLAHRVAWQIIHGAAAPEVVCHRCDTPSCVRAAHLFAGSSVINVADRVDKGRSAIGSRIHNHKLVELDIPEIRARLAQGEPHRAIADRFGVCRASVANIASGKTWRHVS